MEPRLVIDGATGAPANLALEEVLMRGNRGLVLRLWENERSVIIGRAQLARFETDVDRCAKEGIPIVRRVTAGGAVYNGPGNINWSLFVARECGAGAIRYLWSARELFRMASGLVVRAVGHCGVKAWLDEPNRILTAEGKVGGMAAYLSRAGLLCHGTLLLGANLEEVESLTRPAEAQLDRKYTRSKAMRVANTGISPDAFIASMRRVLEEETGTVIEHGGPTDQELGAMQLLLPKYEDPAWNLGDPFAEGAV